jgi:hypothetical protein
VVGWLRGWFLGGAEDSGGGHVEGGVGAGVGGGESSEEV